VFEMFFTPAGRFGSSIARKAIRSMSFATPEGEKVILPAGAVAGDPALPWLHALSDVAMGLAYVSVPAVLLLLLLRRRDLAFPWLIGLFAAFILAGGATHLIGAFTIIQPAPVIEGLAKAVTAAVSMAFAIALWPALPRLLSLRSPAALEREVEERRAAEQRARESEARARDSEARMAEFVAHLSEGLFVFRVAPDGTLLVETLNPAFEQMFGVEAASMLGRPVEEVMPPVLTTLCQPRWREAVLRGERLDYELTGDVPAGRLAWQTVLVPIRGASGRIERLVGSARDVTATRRLQAGLVQSARLATVGTMCAGLAHEASQPLNVAALWLRRARAAGEALASDQKAPLVRAFEILDDQLRRAGELVSHIRALAGEEPGRMELFDPTQPVAAALQVAASQYAPEGIALAMEGAAEGIPVRGSPARLEQAILQLLRNARDAVLERQRQDPGAPARIMVTLRQEPGRVAIEVRDSGTGIPEALQHAVFDPFFTTKDPGRGAGLGLPFACGVARGMGGGIEAWNLPEGGACFRMELAAGAAAAAPCASTVAA
jgi:PAS domain S-box-containing protein